MVYLEAVDLDKSKSQAVCFSGEASLNHDKKRNNWSTLPSSSPTSRTSSNTLIFLSNIFSNESLSQLLQTMQLLCSLF